MRDTGQIVAVHHGVIRIPLTSAAIHVFQFRVVELSILSKLFVIRHGNPSFPVCRSFLSGRRFLRSLLYMLSIALQP